MVVFVCHEATMTGAPTSGLDLCRLLSEKYGYTFLFVFQRGGPLLDDFRALGEVLIFDKEYTNGIIPFRFRLWWHRIRFKQALFGAKSLELLYFNTIAVNNKLASLLKILQRPTLTHVREGYTVCRWLLTRSEARGVLDQSDRFIAISRNIKNMLKEDFQVSEENITIIPNGIHLGISSIVVHTLRSTNEFIVIGCGSLLYRKGVDLFIRTAHYLKNVLHVPHIRFIWIGGNLNSLWAIELINEVEKLGLTEIVHFVGSTNNVRQYYRKGDIFFLSSREEPFGKVMIEAALYGMPVVAFRKSGFPEEYVDEQVGFLADYADVEEAALRINQLLNDPKLYKRCAENNAIKAKTYTIEKVAESVHLQIKEMCKI